MDDKKFKIEMENKMKRETAFFKQQALNTNLTPSQHVFMAEMATVRHYIHANPKAVYLENKDKLFYDYYFNNLINMQVSYDLRISFPYEIIKQYNNLETISKLAQSSRSVDSQIKMFVQEKEYLNEAFEDYMIRIDREYGTEYYPHHYKRDPKINYQAMETKKINKELFSVSDLNSKELTERATVFLNKRLVTMGFNPEVKVGYISAQNNAATKMKTVHMFTQCPMDKKTFDKLIKSERFVMSKQNLSFNFIYTDNLEKALNNLKGTLDKKNSHVLKEKGGRTYDFYR